MRDRFVEIAQRYLWDPSAVEACGSELGLLGMFAHATLDEQPMRSYEYESAIVRERGLIDWEVGYLAPKPFVRSRRWYAAETPEYIFVYWRCIWDFNDDGWMDLRDFVTFGEQYQHPWTLSDFVAFASLYAGPSDRVFIYERGV